MRTQLKRFQEALKRRHLDGAVIAAPETLSSVNLRYLSGFSGSSAFLVIAQERAWILTDFRYLEQAEHQAPDFELVSQKSEVSVSIAQICIQQHIRRLGFEADKVPLKMWQGWNSTIPVVWEPLDQLVEQLRVVKTTDEIALISRAADIAGAALQDILPHIVGQRELDVALELELAMRRRGVEALAFETIVASGERGSMPHGHPTERVIQPGELVTIDFGARVDGYHSDETVTVATGPVSDELAQVFDVVRTAQTAGIAAVKPGVLSHQVDKAARDVIERAGFGECFGHGTGHGVGLEVHEGPYAHALRPGSDDVVLEPGMTITVEPGIYVPGKGGVRLEDTLVVTESGCKCLTTQPKHFRTVRENGHESVS